jgi:hypothetical protein
MYSETQPKTVTQLQQKATRQIKANAQGPPLNPEFKSNTQSPLMIYE